MSKKILSSIVGMLIVLSFSSVMFANPLSYDGETQVVDTNIEIGTSSNREAGTGIKLINGSDITFNGTLGHIYGKTIGLHIDSSKIVMNHPILIDIETSGLLGEYGVYINNTGGAGSKSEVTFGDDLTINMAFSSAASSNVGPRAGLAIDLDNETEAVLNIGDGLVITTTAPDTIGKSGDGLLFTAQNESKITAIIGEGAKITVDHFSIAPLQIKSYGGSEVEVTFGDGIELYNTIRRTAGADILNGVGLAISSQDGGSATAVFGNDTVISGDAVGIKISADGYYSTADVLFGNNAGVEIYSNKPFSSGIYARIDTSQGGKASDVLESSISMNFGDGTTIKNHGIAQSSTGVIASIGSSLTSASISMIFGNETTIESNGDNSSAYSYALTTSTGADLSEIFMKFGNKTTLESKGAYSPGIYLHEGGKSSKTTLIFGDETIIKTIGDSGNNIDVYPRHAGIHVYSHKQDNTDPLNHISSMTFGNKTTIEAKGYNMNGIFINATDTAPGSNILMKFGNEVNMTAGLHGIQVNTPAKLTDVSMKFGDKVNITSNIHSKGNGLYTWAEAEGSKISMEFGDEVNITAGNYGIYSYIQGKSSQVSMKFGDKIDIISENSAGIRAYILDSTEGSEVHMEFGNEVNIISKLGTGTGIDLIVRPQTKATVISMKFGDKLNIETDATGIGVSLRGEGSEISMIFGEGANIEAGYMGNGISLGVQGEDSEISMTFGEGTNIHVYDADNGFNGIHVNMNVAASDSEIFMEFGNKTNITVDSIMEGINVNISSEKSEVSMIFGDETEIRSNSSGISINMPDSAEESVVFMEFGNEAQINASDYGINANAQAKLSEISMKLGDKMNIETSNNYSVGIYVNSNEESAKVSMELGDEVNIKSYYGIYALSNEEKSEISMIFGDKLNIETKNVGIYAYIQPNGTSSKIAMTFGDEANIKTSSNFGIYAPTDGEFSEISIVFGKKAMLETASTGVYIWAEKDSTSYVSFDSDAKITTRGVSAHGVYVRAEAGSDAHVEFKDNAAISTENKTAHGAYYRGGTISFGDNAVISVSGIEADAFYFAEVAASYSPTYNNMTATSALSNLIGNGSGSATEMTFTGASKLYGDLTGFSSGSDITLNLEDATTWEGNALISGSGTYNVNLFNTAAWIIRKDSEVDNLNMTSTSSISFITNIFSNPTFSTATVGNLTGSGIINMNVDLSPDTLDGDFLDVDTASGDYTLVIGHNNVGGAKELALVSVDSPQSGLKIALSGDNEDKIQVGAYNYILDDRNPGGSETEWFLKRLGLDDNIKEETQVSVIGLEEFAKSIDGTLSDEFLKINNKLWFTSFYKLQKFDKKIIETSFKQQVGGLIMGLDESISDNFRIGQFIGLNIGYQDLGQNSIGHVASLTTGIYANYTNRGLLASGYVRVANYIHDLRLQGSLGDYAAGTMNTYGWSASMQLSKRISLSVSDVYITPKAKATYTYVKGKTYDVGGMPVQNLDVTGLVTWLGARVGIEKDNCETSYGYYLEAGWVHDTNPSVTVMILDFEESETKTIFLGNNRFEAGIGFYTSPLGVSSFNAEFKYSRGEGIEEPIKINIGGSVYY